MQLNIKFSKYLCISFFVLRRSDRHFLNIVYSGSSGNPKLCNSSKIRKSIFYVSNTFFIYVEESKNKTFFCANRKIELDLEIVSRTFVGNEMVKANLSYF